MHGHGMHIESMVRTAACRYLIAAKHTKADKKLFMILPGLGDKIGDKIVFADTSRHPRRQ